MDKNIRVLVITDVKIPIVPNFLIHRGNSIPVGDVTNDELKEVGKIWLEKLIQNAERQRKLKRRNNART